MTVKSKPCYKRRFIFKPRYMRSSWVCVFEPKKPTIWQQQIEPFLYPHSPQSTEPWLRRVVIGRGKVSADIWGIDTGLGFFSLTCRFIYSIAFWFASALTPKGQICCLPNPYLLVLQPVNLLSRHIKTLLMSLYSPKASVVLPYSERNTDAPCNFPC